jgi:diacylglycerol kinase family enzyme
MRVTVVHNPGAGDEEPSRETLDAAISAAGHEARWQSVKEDDWQDVLSEPDDLVVVAGGDGTVRKVFRELAGTALPATLLPVGSANNIARSLGFDDDPVRLIGGWSSAARQPFDVGELSVEEDETSFVESVGGGLFADVLERAEESGDDPGGDDKVEQGLRLLLDVLADAEPRPWRVEVDGLELADDLLAVEAMNIRETGPNIPLAPEADPQDGKLDVALTRPAHKGELQRYLEARLEGGPVQPPAFDVRRGEQVVLQPPDGATLRVDDKLAGSYDGRGLAYVRHRLGVLVPR